MGSKRRKRGKKSPTAWHFWGSIATSGSPATLGGQAVAAGMLSRSCPPPLRWARPPRPGPFGASGPGAASSTTGACGCRVSRPAIRPSLGASAPCCPPAGTGARARRRHRRWTATAAARPASPGGGPARRGSARASPARAGRRGSRQAPSLPAAGCARLRRQGPDRLVSEPHRQAPAPAQPGLAGWPVRDPAPRRVAGSRAGPGTQARRPSRSATRAASPGVARATARTARSATSRQRWSSSAT